MKINTTTHIDVTLRVKEAERLRAQIRSVLPTIGAISDHEVLYGVLEQLQGNYRSFSLHITDSNS